VIAEVTVSSSPSVVVHIVQPLAEIVVTKPSNIVEVITSGVQGPRGNSFLSGEGAPAESLGIDLDLYIDLVTGYIYKKQSNVWTFRAATVPQERIYTITAEQVEAKRIVLDLAPSNPERVTFTFLNGTTQTYGQEFIVQGDILTWEGYPLDGFIEEGDVVSVAF